MYCCDTPNDKSYVWTVLLLVKAGQLLAVVVGNCVIVVVTLLLPWESVRELLPHCCFFTDNSILHIKTPIPNSSPYSGFPAESISGLSFSWWKDSGEIYLSYLRFFIENLRYELVDSWTIKDNKPIKFSTTCKY